MNQNKEFNDGPNSRMEGIEKRILKLKCRMIGTTQCKQLRCNRLEKIKSRASGTYGTITKNLIFVLSEYQNERRKWGLEITKFPQFC